MLSIGYEVQAHPPEGTQVVCVRACVCACGGMEGEACVWKEREPGEKEPIRCNAHNFSCEGAFRAWI